MEGKGIFLHFYMFQVITNHLIIVGEIKTKKDCVIFWVITPFHLNGFFLFLKFCKQNSKITLSSDFESVEMCAYGDDPQICTAKLREQQP